MGRRPAAPTASDLLQGTLDVMVLKALTRGAMHGYAVAEFIHLSSNDVLRVEEGALYPALQRLLRKGLVHAEWGVSENNRRAKYYGLTAEGRKQLRSEISSWRKYAEAMLKVVGETGT